MRKTIVMLGMLLLAVGAVNAQTFPVQNLQVNGNAALGGTLTANGFIRARRVR